MELARRFKKAALKPRLGWGLDLITRRMYSTLPTIWHGWGRNFIAASRGRPWRVIAGILFLLCCTFTVWPALVAGLSNDKALDAAVWLILAGAHYVLITLALVDGYRWGRSDVRYALLWPLGLLALLIIFFRSLYLSSRRQVVWRGVRYDLNPGKATP